MSVFRVFLVRMRENTEQKISEYRHFSRSGSHAGFSQFTLIYVPKNPENAPA